MLTVRNIASDLNVTEATIRKKLKQMEDVERDERGHFILTEEIYSKFLYKFYPKRYAISSRCSVVVHEKGHHMISTGKINKITKPNGKTYYYLSQFPIGYDDNGKEIYRKSTGLPTREACQELRKQWIAERGDIAKTKRELDEYHDSFYWYCRNLYKTNKNLTDSSRLQYVTAIDKHLKDFFKKVPVSKINPKCLNEFTRGHLHSNVQTVKAIITRALKTLYTSEVLEKDLRPFVEYPKQNHLDKRVPLSKSQLHDVFDYFVSHRLELCIHLLFKSGVRAGEALALQWTDIELLDDNLVIIDVSKAIGYTDVGYTVKDPKNVYSKRQVYVYDEYLWKLLEEAMKTAKTKWVIVNKWNISHVNYEVLRRELREAGEAIGLPHRLTPHIARHTYISMCLHNGIKPEYIAPQVGHADTKMIYSVYGKATEDRKSIYKSMSNF
ncbi:tyrosine-type recombinase/integrase [Veillonella intestinalis]|uniref:tyrosine-type recombinase/integrase n=1 Tax=Veillonella intestinalis TaxID=2941341 RepID=UPI00203F28A5|nr:tyrosine-type recombinase/integrase [Veillonella intestinalis]